MLAPVAGDESERWQESSSCKGLQKECGRGADRPVWNSPQSSEGPPNSQCQRNWEPGAVILLLVLLSSYQPSLEPSYQPSFVEAIGLQIMSYSIWEMVLNLYSEVRLWATRFKKWFWIKQWSPLLGILLEDERWLLPISCWSCQFR